VNGGSIPSSRTNKISPDPLLSFKSLETMHDTRQVKTLSLKTDVLVA